MTTLRSPPVATDAYAALSTPELRQTALNFADQGQFDVALALMQLIWQRHPSAENLANVGIAQMLANAPQSVATLQQAFAAHPSPHTEWHLAQALMKSGQWLDAWPHFGARHRANGVTLPQFASDRLQSARTWLLLPEQGYGDMFQFLRYIPTLNPALKLILYLPVPLVRLAQLNFPQASVVTYGHPQPAHDIQLGLGDLPGLCHCTPATVMAQTPYLRVRPADMAVWHQRLPEGLRVGLVWSGNPQLETDRRRSIPPALLAPLLRNTTVHWISLQLPAQPLPGVLDVSADIRDFYDTACLISQLDLVIAVDTAVAHLAGALGVPVWLLNRHDSEWRWMVGRADSPWYPTLRIFRQQAPGDWPGVLHRVEFGLQQLLRR